MPNRNDVPARITAMTILAVIASLALLTASDAPPQTVSFEVASVKPNKTASARTGFDERLPYYRATNVTLKSLIMGAYGLHSREDAGRIVGGPSWIDIDRFDIVARAGADVAQRDMDTLLRTLLMDRFQLRTHMETRDRPTYALVVARAGGVLGTQIRRSSLDCSGPDAYTGAASGIRQAATVGAGSRGATGSIFAMVEVKCGLFSAGSDRGTRMLGGGRTMADLATSLGSAVDRPVVDATELTGIFDLVLQFTRDTLQPGSTDTSPLPSIFTALQDQLGLKLESRRGGVEFLVIDHVEQPTAD